MLIPVWLYWSLVFIFSVDLLGCVLILGFGKLPRTYSRGDLALSAVGAAGWLLMLLIWWHA